MKLKRAMSLLCVFGFSCGLLSSCGNRISTIDSSSTSSLSEEEQKVYDIYLLAKEAGFTGTYEEWLATVKGEKGDTGAAGTNGTDGASFLTGAGVPAATLGKDGDAYLNTTTYDIYVKASGAWTVAGNIKGLAGTVGATGATGAKGDTGDTGATGATGYSSYIVDETNHKFDIYDAFGFISFRNYVNSGFTFEGWNVSLKNDIDLNHMDWEPIGSYYRDTSVSPNTITEIPFKGIFDGNDKTISNFQVTKSGGYSAGLFGDVKGDPNSSVLTMDDAWNSDQETLKTDNLNESNYTAAIKNLNLEGATITSVEGETKHTAAVVGYSENVYFSNINLKTVVVDGYKGVGGIAGVVNGCVFDNIDIAEDCSITAEKYNVGGIVGYSPYSNDTYYPNVYMNSTNNASVVEKSSGGVGGIVGFAQSGGVYKNLVYKCTNRGNITSEGGGYVGGIVGLASSVASTYECENYGTVKNTSETASTSYVSGINSYSSGSFIRCHNNGNLEGYATAMGGITSGTVAGPISIKNCANTGSITNTNTNGETATILSKGNASYTVTNISDMTFANVDALNKALPLNACSINLTDVTVTDKSGTLIVPDCQSFTSDNELAEGIKLSQKSTSLANNITIDVPNNTVVFDSNHNDANMAEKVVIKGKNSNFLLEEGAQIGGITLSGDGSTGLVKGTVNGAVGLSGKASELTIADTGKADSLFIKGNGAKTVTNNGLIKLTVPSDATGGNHTIFVSGDTTDLDVTFNNFGRIWLDDSSALADYLFCLHDYHSFVLNAHSGSSLLTTLNWYTVYSNPDISINYESGATGTKTTAGSETGTDYPFTSITNPKITVNEVTF